MYQGPEWANDAKTVIRLSLQDPLTIEEITETNLKGAALLDTVDHKVQMIVDVLRLRTMPPHIISSFPAMNRLPMSSHPNLDRVVLVTENAFLEAVTSIFSRVYRKLEVVRTLDEAYKVVSVDHNAN